MADPGEIEVETTKTSRVETVERPGLTEEAEIEKLVADRLDLTPYKFSRPWMGAFVAVLARTGDASSAARAAQINHTHAFDTRRANPVFAAAWAEAENIAADLLEQVAIRRATVGEERIVRRTTRKFQTVAGPTPEAPTERVLVEETIIEERVHVRSDALLMFLLKARRPEQFRERIDPRHQGAGDAPVAVEVYRFPNLERAAQLAALFTAEQRDHPDVEGHANGSANGTPELPPGDG